MHLQQRTLPSLQLGRGKVLPALQQRYAIRLCARSCCACRIASLRPAPNRSAIAASRGAPAALLHPGQRGREPKPLEVFVEVTAHVLQR